MSRRPTCMRTSSPAPASYPPPTARRSSPAAERTTTIGRELAANPLLAITDEDEFARALLGGLGSYPSYFRRLAEVNRRGPTVLARPPGLDALSAAAVQEHRDRGGEVVDV